MIVAAQEGTGSALAFEVAADLAAVLEPDGIEVRSDGDEGPRGATVVLSVHERRARIDVVDRSTQRHVIRDVDLEGVSPNNEAFAIAMQTEELLRAIWTSAALPEDGKTREAPFVDPEPRSQEQAPEPRPTTAHAEPPETPTVPPRRLHELDGGFVVEHHLSPLTTLGAGIGYRAWPLARLGVEGNLASLAGLPVETPSGSVRTLIVRPGVAVATSLLPDHPRLDVRPAVVAHAMWARFEGLPSGSATGSSGQRWTAALGGRVDVVVWLAAIVGLRVRAQVRAVVRPIGGIDSASGGARLDGVVLGGDAGIVFALPRRAH
ncbi:MAG: hypothetical protein AAF721_29535 [Myxococcota bacterium]